MNDQRGEREHHTGQSSGVPLELLAPEQGVEYKTGLGESVEWERVHLLHTASIGHTSLAHVWVANVVIGAISRTILIFSADVRGRRMRKVVVENLDEFTLELGHSVLQSPIGVLREEVDDVLEAHLPVIERIDMLKRINCGHKGIRFMVGRETLLERILEVFDSGLIVIMRASRR
jgi:hypothetical protein